MTPREGRSVEQGRTRADKRNRHEPARLAIGRHRRSDQAIRVRIHHAESGRELPRPARFADQLRLQRAAHAALPAREDRRADRARLRQGQGPADGGDPAQPGRAPARADGHLLRLYRPGADLHHGGDRPDGRRQAAPAYRLDAHRPRAGRGRAPLRQMGLPADLGRGRAGILRARLFGHDDRAAGPDLHVLRRGPAGGSARDGRAAAARACGGDAGADDAGSARPRGDRRSPRHGGAPASPRRVRRPARRRLRGPCRARRDGRRRRLGHQQFPQLPQPAPPLRQPRQGLPQERRSRRRPRRQGLGEADARAQLDEAHPRVARARDERLGRDRLRRGRNLEMVDGLRAHAALLGARARRHRPRHPGADAPVPRAHRRRRHGSRLRSTSAGRPSVSATTKPGPGGRTRRARIGTSRR